MSTIMFYTPKANLRPNDRRKLKQAGITAIQVDDPKEVHWPNMADLSFHSVHGELGLVMLRALTMSASQSTNAETHLGRSLLAVMRCAVGMQADGTLLKKRTINENP